MGKLTNYAEKKWMDHIFKVASFTVPTHLYILLFTADPTDAGSGAEVAHANNYERVMCDAFNSASSRNIKNTSLIEFPQANGSWGTVTHWGISDSGTYGGGNLIAYGQLTDQKVIVSGNIPTIAAQAISITVDTGYLSTYLSNKMLDHTFKVAPYTVPTNIKLACSTANPTDDGSGLAEPSGNNYSRTTVNAWDACHASNGNTQNTNAITTPTASGNWGTITHTALFDDTTNMLWYGAMSPSQAVGNGDWLEWPIGAFVCSID